VYLPTRDRGVKGESAVVISQEEHLKELDKGYRFDWKDPSHAVFEPKRGLSPAVVEEISGLKSEPDWMRKRRLKALQHFEARPMPWWGADLSDIDFDNIFYFIRSTEKQAGNWDELPRTSRARGTSWASRRPRRSTSAA
jgi:Fe-S cluster assembly protein SufB